ncbi:MAG: sugar ABC transporter permease [Clostridia bacterium]|jgi:multiple sugar transport system permease protein|nr:sugar ABC transporter permease [Clostridia bacterium]
MTKQTQVSLSPALRRRRLTETGIGYLFIGPWLFCFLAFNLVPFVISFVLSFMDYNMLSAPTFVGLSNYVKLFTGDKLFKTSLGVTFRFVFIAIPLRLAFALLVALILNRQSKMVPLYRVVYYLPSILGGSVAVSVMWRYCFSKTGVLNTALQAIGIASNISWISNKDTALWSLILLFIWQFGSPMLIFLSGLKQIPKSYYEAAECDGAGPLVRFFRITLPLLTPIIFFNLVMQMIGGFMVFSQAMIITDGGPMNRTLVYALYLYRQSFAYYKMGYGCAMAWVLMTIIGFFTLLVFRSSSAWVFYENEIK